MNKIFINHLHKEEDANKSKGKWDNWNPHPETWLWEVSYHLSKLQKAIQNNDKKLIKEHSADLGLYAEKSFIKYGLSAKDRISQFQLNRSLKKPSIYRLKFAK